MSSDDRRGGRGYHSTSTSTNSASASGESEHNHHGHRRGRGRGGGRGRYNRDDGNSDGQRPRGSGGGGRPPPHLRGKAIGLFYRDRAARENQQIKSETEAAIRDKFSCALTPARQERLTKLIMKLNQTPYDETKSSVHFQLRYQKNLAANERVSEYQGRSVKFKNDDEKESLDAHSEDFHQLFSAKPDPSMDAKLKQEWDDKQSSRSYQNMQKFRQSLPAHGLREKIVECVQENQVVIISGETGCGKTTQVGQFILDSEINANRGSKCNIICTQPRRISAITVAERVANERDESIGNSVGYCIRLESRYPCRTSGTITFMTTGIIFQCMKNHPNLENVSHLIIDEIHERSIHSDFLITILKDILHRRPKLKVILMSATMNAREFSEYYNNAPILNIPGFTYPIKEYYLEDALAHTGFSFSQQEEESQRRGGFRRNNNYFDEKTDNFQKMIKPYIQDLRNTGQNLYSPRVLTELQNPSSEELNVDFIQSLIEHICRTDDKYGAILIFVTGWDVISKLTNALNESGKFPSSAFRIYPLHSMMPTVNQKEIFSRPPQGIRKIVIATQIAETSITIDDVVYVIDSGKIKLGNFDESLNLATLDVECVSQANATQRRGRAGRVQEGVVYHLFSRARASILEKFKKPEILRTRLEEVILQIKILHLGKANFLKRLMNPPSDRSMSLALERLVELQAIYDTQEEKLTPLGFHLANLPMDPQTGKMILMGSIFSCADPIFSIAASLSFKDPFYVPLGKEQQVNEIRKRFSGQSKSDHVILARVIQAYEKSREERWERKFCYQNFLSENTLKMLINMKGQFADYLVKLGFLSSSNYKTTDLNRNSNNLGIITALTAAGLYPNVVQINFMGRSGRVALRCGHQKVKFHPGSVNIEERKFESPYMVYFKKVKSSNIFLHDTTMVNPFALIFFGGRLHWKTPPRSVGLGLGEGMGGSYGESDEPEPSSNSKFNSVSVDGKYDFSYPKEQNFRFIVDSLRTALEEFLEYKVNNPGPTDWSESAKESCLLSTIAEILTTEYKAFMLPSDMDDDDDGGGSDEDSQTSGTNYQGQLFDGNAYAGAAGKQSHGYHGRGKEGGRGGGERYWRN